MKKLMLSLCGISCLISAQNEPIKTIFAHGAFAHPGQAKHFKEAFAQADNFISPRFADNQKETNWNPAHHLIALKTKSKYPTVDYAPSKAYFGQEGDIQILQKAVESSNDKVVLFGECRGGIAAINCLANSKDNPQKIKALVIEGTPAHITEAFNDKFAKLGLPCSISEKLFKYIWSSYPSNSKTTLDALSNIKNKETPILIIHSKEDKNFSFANGLKLYKKCKDEGFSNVYIAPLKGKHCRSLQDDKENYLTAVHSFYKNHQLPHNPTYATANMDQYFYNLEDAEKEINQDATNLKFLIRSRQNTILGVTALCAIGYYAYTHYR